MSDQINLNRRRVLAGLAGSASAVTLVACGNSNGALGSLMPPVDGVPTPPATPVTPGGPLDTAVAPAPQPPAGKTLPKPEDSGIDHIVIVMMENRTFDHMLGWVPGADGVQAGRQFKNVEGKPVDSFALSADTAYGFGGCAWADPSHGYAAGRTHLNNGAMDGWLLTGGTKDNPADRFPAGYFTENDLPFYKGVAANWTVCDKYFSGILSSTYPNRFYMHSGETDRMTNTFDISSLPTIWDRLAAKNVTAKYYFQDLPLLALWGSKYVATGTVLPMATFMVQAAAGLLPSMSYVEPRFLGEGNQVANDDHPASDVRDGQLFLNQVYNALRQSPNWEKTLLIINYDEWGGFADHVVPPVGPVSAAEAALGNDGRLGFRVPCLIIGPRAPKAVCKLQFDPQSILNLITWRFGLEPVGSRAAWSLNMAYALDFDNLRSDVAPTFDAGSGLFGKFCGDPLELLPVSLPVSLPVPVDAAESHFGEWLVLKTMARRYGFI